MFGFVKNMFITAMTFIGFGASSNPLNAIH